MIEVSLLVSDSSEAYLEVLRSSKALLVVPKAVWLGELYSVSGITVTLTPYHLLALHISQQPI